jgi:glycosyltransferase involved in cell wall biosynthesis
MNEPKSLSVIVPLLNEEGSIAQLHAEIVAACRALGRPFEIILVNDGSTDKTAQILSTLSPAKVITLRRNFGQTAALDAGIKAAQGDYVVPMDGDGQNDPADIGKLIMKLESEHLDVVSGWRKDRKDTSAKRWSSLAAAFVRRLLIKDGIHDSGCTLKVYKRECFKHTTLFGEIHRFIPAILRIKGFTLGEVEVNHRPRTAGASKYHWSRGIKGGLDMLAIWFWHKYANRPLHFFGAGGILLMVLSFLSGTLAVYLRVFYNEDLSDTALTMLSMLGFFTGLLLLAFGLISDMLCKIYFGSTNDPSYDIKEVTDR